MGIAKPKRRFSKSSRNACIVLTPGFMPHSGPSNGDQTAHLRLGRESALLRTRANKMSQPVVYSGSKSQRRNCGARSASTHYQGVKTMEREREGGGTQRLRGSSGTSRESERQMRAKTRYRDEGKALSHEADPQRNHPPPSLPSSAFIALPTPSPPPSQITGGVRLTRNARTKMVSLM